jgi:hypothetical protein
MEGYIVWFADGAKDQSTNLLIIVDGVVGISATIA